VYEILTLVQTHKIEKVPIILVGSDFWKAVEEMMRKEMLSRGMIDEPDISLYTITDDEDEIIRIIREAPVRNGIPFTIPKREKSALAAKKCIPCEGGTSPLEHKKSEDMLSHVNQWTLVEDTSIEKTFKMKDFNDAMHFVDRIAAIAEEENHHPDIHIFNFNKVRIVLSTHAIKGLSENDFIMAAKIDEMLRN